MQDNQNKVPSADNVESRREHKKYPDGIIRIFHWIKTFLPQYGPGVDSASNRNEYKESLLGVKAASA